ncbi:MAG: hypothetical protein KAI16_00955 [Candidatus Pacebacteria bacterium]|nr:hypothetical protein [Candidatus Paceibacterota bacterium]
MNKLQNNHKGGLKEIILKLPFVPTLSIERKKFFVGVFLIAITAFVINMGFIALFDGMNFIFSIVLSIIFSYIIAIWYTKRFLDIKPTTNAKIFQISFFVLFLALNMLTYIQADMAAELRAPLDHIALYGLDAINEAPEVSATTERYAVPVSIARAIIGIPLLLFTLFLFFKKRKKQKIENRKIKDKHKESHVEVINSNNNTDIKYLVTSFLKKHKKKIIALSFSIILIFAGVQFYIDYVNYTYKNIKECESHMDLLEYSSDKRAYYHVNKLKASSIRKEEGEDMFWARFKGALKNNDGKLDLESWEIYPETASWYTNRHDFCEEKKPFLKYYFNF